MALAHDMKHALWNSDSDVVYDNCVRCYHDTATGQPFDHITRQPVDCRCGPGVTTISVRIEPDSGLGLGYIAITDVVKKPCHTAQDCGQLPCRTYIEAHKDIVASTTG